MKLTNNKLEKLIMEVLAESTGQEYEIDGNKFSITDGTAIKDFKDMLDDSSTKVQKITKVRRATGLDLKTAKAIVNAYVEDKKPINVAKPKAFDLPTFNNLLDAVMTAATKTDQNAVDAAKQASTAYYQQYTQEAQAAIKADPALQQKIKDATAAKAKFDFAQLQAEINKVAAATDLPGLKKAETDLTSYYTANKADVDADTSEKAKYDAAIKSIPALKAKFQNAAFQKKIDDAAAIAANTASGESTLKATKKDLEDKKANDPDFAAYVTNNPTDYDAAIKDLGDAIDLIVNKWKSPDEAIGIETPADIDPSSTKSYTDQDRNKILKALQTSFGTLIPQADLKMIAGLSEGKERFLIEDTNTLELSDIETYIDDLLSKDPKTLNATEKAQHATDLALADKIDQALKDYINQVRDPARATRLKKAKRAYDALLVKQRGLTPSRSTKYSATDRIPTATTVGGTQKTPVDPVVVDSFMTFFKDHHTIQEKIKFLSEFSEAVAEAAGGNPADLNNSTKFPAEKVIVGGNILSMLSRATRQIDSSAGGLIVEALLAFMVSGEKIGQAGGAADFKGPSGKLYSSKWGQTSKGQSKDNFNNLGEIITYVSAYKHQTSKVPKGASGKPLLSETVFIHEVDISVYDVITTIKKKEIRKGVVGQFKKYAGKTSFSGIGGTKAKNTSTTDKNGNHTHFNVSPDNISGLTEYKIKFVVSEDQIFDQIFSEAVAAQADALVKAVTRLNSLSKSLEEQATSYTVTGDFSDAVSLANSHKDIRKQIETIYLEKEGPSSGAKIADIGLTESKLQTLDQLIAETMREIKRKRKK